jgi:hypothetical protein
LETILGLFRSYEDAERAVSRLREHGFVDHDLGLVGRRAGRGADDFAGVHVVDEAVDDEIADDAAGGALGGAAIGGLAGLLVGIGALSIPGVGPALAAGSLGAALSSTLAGAGLGAATGGLLGALVGAGVPEEEAHVYAEGVKRGGVLLSVNTRERGDEVRRLLHEGGAADVESYRSEWRRAGWQRFDDAAEPGPDYPRL